MNDKVSKRNPLTGLSFLLMIIGIFGSGVVVAVSSEHLDMDIFIVRTFSSVAATVGFLLLMYYYIEGYKKNDKLFILPMLCLTVCLIMMLVHIIIFPVDLLLVMAILMGIAILLSVIPFFKINNVRLVIFCFITICLLVLTCSVIQFFVVFIPMLFPAEATVIFKIGGVLYWFCIPMMSLCILFGYIENTKRKAKEAGNTKWIERGDGSYWKFN